MNILKYYRFYISVVVIFLIGILLSASVAFAQFTPTQNAYLIKNELLKNGDAEQGTASWIVNGALSTISNDYYSGSRSFRMSLSAQTLSFCQSIDTSIKLNNADLISSCRIKTTNPNIQICNTVNGVNQDCAPVDNTGFWEFSRASNKFLSGAAPSGICVISTTAISDIVGIDGCTLSETVSSSVNLSSDVSGVLPTTNGGTNVSSAGLIGNVLTSDGSNWFSSALPDTVSKINDLVTESQYLTSSESGSNFSITSSADTHTFNLPVASAVNTGKLSSSDWTSFNAKLTGAGASIDSEIVLFSGASGNVIKRATGTGIAKITNGVLSTGGVSLATDVTGLLPVANGGTNLSSTGVVGNVLTSNGSGWSSSPLPVFMESINTLSATQQFIVSGTSGSDFSISSSVDTHTLNLPVASVTKTGKLSSTDWNTFNNKQNAISILPVANGGTGVSTIPLNEVILGNGTSAIQTVSPSVIGNVLTANGTAWISAPPSGGGGSVSLFNSSDLTLTGGDTIAISLVIGDNIQKWLVQGDAGPVTLSATPFGASAPEDGTEILLIGNDNTNSVTITFSDVAKGCVVNGNITLLRYESITLVYDQTLDRYIEKSRNN